MLAVELVKNGIFLMASKSNASKEVFRTMAKLGVEGISTLRRVNRKPSHSSLITGEILIVPLAKARNENIMTIGDCISSLIILAIQRLVGFKTFITIFALEEIFTSTIFAVYITILFVKNIRKQCFKFVLSFEKRDMVHRIKIRFF